MRRRAFLMAAGAAIGVGWRARAQQQQQPVPLIGFLHGSALVGPYPVYVARFLDGLKEQGFEPGRNLALEYRWAEGHYDRVPALTAELLALGPALIVVYGPPNVVRAAI